MGVRAKRGRASNATEKQITLLDLTVGKASRSALNSWNVSSKNHTRNLSPETMMSISTTQAGENASFVATLYFSDAQEIFTANRIVILSSVSVNTVNCWTIKAVMDSKDPKTNTPKSQTILIHIRQDQVSGNVTLGAALTFPDIAENTAGYYVLTDSPDDDDDDLDAVFGFPSVRGNLVYQRPEDNAHIVGHFNFDLETEEKTSFSIKGTFNVAPSLFKTA